MKTKPIPVIITLSAALISCVMSLLQRVEFKVFVSRLLVVVVIFLFMGTIIKMILDYSFRTLEPTVSLDEQMDGIQLDGSENEESTEDEEATEGNKAESEEG